MSWLRFIPWGTVVSNAPEIYKTVKSFLDSEREHAINTESNPSPEEINKRILKLEHNLKGSYEIIATIIDKNRKLEESLELSRRLNQIQILTNIILIFCFLIWLLVFD